MNHKDIVKALKQIRVDAEWTLRGNSYEDLEWLDLIQEKPTQAEIEAAIANFLPEPELTITEKLASVGISLDELKSALGGN